MSKVLAQYVFFLSLLLALQGCFFSKQPTPDLIVGFSPAPRSLHPSLAADLSSQSMLRLLNQSLLLREDGILQPDLALEHSHHNYTVFTFKLDPQAHFHDGTPVSSQDVKVSYQFYKNTPYFQRFQMDLLQSIQTPDSNTVVLTLNKASSQFLELIVPRLYIFKATELNQSTPQQILTGSGPLKLIQQKRDQWDFEAHPHSRRPSRYERVRFLLVDDMLTRFLKLRNSEIHIALGRFSNETIEQARAHSQISSLETPSQHVQYWMFNHRHPELSQIEVRRHFVKALNITDLIDNKLMGLATPARSLLYPQHQLFHSIENTQTPSRAANGEIEILSSTDRHINSIQMVMLEELRQAGFNVRMSTLEWGIFYGRVEKGEFDVMSLSLQNVQDPEVFYRLLHSRQHPPGMNRGYYGNPSMDKLLDSMQATVDPAQRKRWAKQVQELAIKDLAIVPLFHPHNIILTRKGFEPKTLSPSGSWRSLIE